MTNYLAIASERSDGTTSYRYVEGTGKKSWAWANQLARNFERKPHILSCHVFEITEQERKARETK